jgi:DNA-binding MarR family transcriptional regulator
MTARTQIRPEKIRLDTLKAVLFKVIQNHTELSFRQMAVLLECADEPQTIRGLADKLNISKPAITRAADVLEYERKFIVRRQDPEDRRSVFLCVISEGAKFLRGLETA